MTASMISAKREYVDASNRLQEALLAWIRVSQTSVDLSDLADADSAQTSISIATQRAHALWYEELITPLQQMVQSKERALHRAINMSFCIPVTVVATSFLVGSVGPDITDMCYEFVAEALAKTAERDESTQKGCVTLVRSKYEQTDEPLRIRVQFALSCCQQDNAYYVKIGSFSMCLGSQYHRNFEIISPCGECIPESDLYTIPKSSTLDERAEMLYKAIKSLGFANEKCASTRL
jgi:hypothetical protein